MTPAGKKTPWRKGKNRPPGQARKTKEGARPKVFCTACDRWRLKLVRLFESDALVCTICAQTALLGWPRAETKYGVTHT